MGLLTVNIEKESTWEFNTFGSGGIGLGIVAAEVGTVVLKNPTTGLDESFYYGGAGPGISFGLKKIPKIGKLEIPITKNVGLTGAVGPTAFPSRGIVYVTEVLGGSDLTTSDIQGPCAFIEVGGGIIGGGSGCAMLFGLDLARVAGVILNPGIAFTLTAGTVKFILDSAKGVLLMAGLNVGIQAQIGGAIYFGYLH